jgi:hypothetical protein
MTNVAYGENRLRLGNKNKPLHFLGGTIYQLSPINILFLGEEAASPKVTI